ncbi:serine protease snake-like [Metopolophium dirhodum]|uniref:serine protease snake-like n=1 Tax=Metopolophium dirhodum TaxID=44670 RepID=UPI00298FC18D|nr:serine protease snake-like [Metopolophium dirhodum]
MKSYTKLQCFLTVFLLCFVNSGYNVEILGLYEGDNCGNGETSNYICRNWENCPVPIEELRRNIYPICSFNGITPIVCCPPEKNIHNQFTITTIKPASISPILKTSAATEKCKEYSELIYFKRKDPVSFSSSETHFITTIDCYDANPLISGGEKAEPKEFPHMALLGFGEKPDNESWFCGGSLISNRFVLTAAHCEKTGNINPSYAKWARLGELDYNSKTANARPTDYKIVDRIIHPNYKPPSLYNDIALFRLERDVDFSAYVRPICLNTDNTSTPPTVMATGWGKTALDRRVSPHLLKVRLNIISTQECDDSFSNIQNKKKKLGKGIDENSMLCTGKTKDQKDTCGGDSGGPIQIKLNGYKCMYSQLGITSFGLMCGDTDASAAHTRVSNYISWIEGIVWPTT